MQPNTHLSLIALLLVLFGISSLVEHSLYGGWNRIYFTYGLPFVILQIPVVIYQQNIPSATLLGAQFRSDLIGSLIFQEIAQDTYGFRRRFNRVSLLSINVLHGMLFFDRENGQVTLKGFVNVWILLFVLVWGVFSILGPFPLIDRLFLLAIIGVILGIPLLMEQRRCVKLANFAANAWKSLPEKATSV